MKTTGDPRVSRRARYQQPHGRPLHGRARRSAAAESNDSSPEPTSDDRPSNEPASKAASGEVEAAPVKAGDTAPRESQRVSMREAENQNFGGYLRRAREDRELVLAEVAQKTKVSKATLELLERGQVEGMPAVYVRGFIRSFARALGADETEPLLMYERSVEARTAAEKARSSTPVLPPPEPTSDVGDDENLAPRRGLGLAVFVIILLLIATITLSLLLRRPPPTGEGLSLGPESGAQLASHGAGNPAIPGHRRAAACG